MEVMFVSRSSFEATSWSFPSMYVWVEVIHHPCISIEPNRLATADHKGRKCNFCFSKYQYFTISVSAKKHQNGHQSIEKTEGQTDEIEMNGGVI